MLSLMVGVGKSSNHAANTAATLTPQLKAVAHPGCHTDYLQLLLDDIHFDPKNGSLIHCRTLKEPSNIAFCGNSSI
jgi:hypothetical protein